MGTHHLPVDLLLHLCVLCVSIGREIERERERGSITALAYTSHKPSLELSPSTGNKTETLRIESEICFGKVAVCWTLLLRVQDVTRNRVNRSIVFEVQYIFFFFANSQHV